MSIYKINQLSQYAFETLEAAKTTKIHSIYRKTINLDVNGQILALQTKGSPLSPISLITDLGQEDMDASNLQVHQQVSIKNLSYKEAQVLDLALNPYKACSRKEDLQILKTSLRAVIASSNTKGFDLIFNHSKEVDDNLILRAAGNHLLSLQELLEEPDLSATKAARQATKLLGLGIGLTPSGDDFLSGLLAGLILCDQNESAFARALKEEITGHLKDTNDISRAFLSCALKGQFSQSIKMLQENPGADPGTIQENFQNIGHSSGIDSLCGIFFCLEHFGTQ